MYTRSSPVRCSKLTQTLSPIPRSWPPALTVRLGSPSGEKERHAIEPAHRSRLDARPLPAEISTSQSIISLPLVAHYCACAHASALGDLIAALSDESSILIMPSFLCPRGTATVAVPSPYESSFAGTRRRENCQISESARPGVHSSTETLICLV